MSKRGTTEEVKSPGAISDQRPDENKQAVAVTKVGADGDKGATRDETKQAVAATSDQRPKEIDKAAVVASDPHPEQVKKSRPGLRRFAPVLILLLAAAIL